MLAQVVGAGRGASGTFRGERGTRAELPVAGAAAGRAPRGRRLCARVPVRSRGREISAVRESSGPEWPRNRLAPVWL